MDGQWCPTVQHRELCVIRSLFCTTEIEIEETRQINYALTTKKELKKKILNYITYAKLASLFEHNRSDLIKGVNPKVDLLSPKNSVLMFLTKVLGLKKN